MSRHRKHRIKLKSLYVWHRYIGLAAALFTIVLSVTGIMLNHTEELELDNTHVQSNALLDWYGVTAPDSVTSFRTGERYVTRFGYHIYLDTHELDGEYDRLTGAVAANDQIVIATDHGILLLTTEGELIEHLRTSDGLPEGITGLGIDTNGTVVARTAFGSIRPGPDFLDWSKTGIPQSEIHWATPATLPAGLQDDLLHHYRGEILPWERVLLDIHSGRILTRNGILVMDMVGVLLILLALSGLYMWMRRRR